MPRITIEFRNGKRTRFQVPQGTTSKEALISVTDALRKQGDGLAYLGSIDLDVVVAVGEVQSIYMEN